MSSSSKAMRNAWHLTLVAWSLIKICDKVYYHALALVNFCVKICALPRQTWWWYKSSLYTRRAIAEWCPQGFAAWPRRSAAPWRQPGICQRHQIIFMNIEKKACYIVKWNLKYSIHVIICIIHEIYISTFQILLILR